jgi:hypothetical protein
LAGGETQFSTALVSYDETVDKRMVEAHAASGTRFLSRLPVGPECQILTMIPTVNTSIGTARALAARLGRELVEPGLTDLATFDGSHLTASSAERWSRAFLEAAGPRIRSCLTTATVSQSNEP